MTYDYSKFKWVESTKHLTKGTTKPAQIFPDNIYFDQPNYSDPNWVDPEDIKYNDETYSEETFQLKEGFYVGYVNALGVYLPQRFSIDWAATTKLWKRFNQTRNTYVLLMTTVVPGVMGSFVNNLPYAPIIAGGMSRLKMWALKPFAAFGRSESFNEPLSEEEEKQIAASSHAGGAFQQVSVKIVDPLFWVNYLGGNPEYDD